MTPTERRVVQQPDAPVPVPEVRPGTPRTTVQARLPDGRIFEAPPGTLLNDFLAAAFPRAEAGSVPAVAAIVDGRLRELRTPLERDADVTPVLVTDADGARIYRRSLAFLLVTAAAEVFPEAELSVEHSAPTVGGYFCSVRGRAPFSADDLRVLDARMRAIVAADEPIEKSLVPVSEATQLFYDRGELDKARLLAHRRRDTLVLYSLRGRRDYFQGYMVPSTGCLRGFGFERFTAGFLLCFPHQARPLEVAHVEPYPKLFEVFEEAGEWLDKLGIRSAGSLNDAIQEGRLPEISLVAEALHEARIAKIASEIVAAGERIRVVLVAGPSSSGKTTFSKRLAVQLLANGHHPFPLALDDYFVDRELTPVDEHGDADFEALHALDVHLFNEHLLSLMSGRTTTLPRFSFVLGRREPGQTVTLTRDHVIIVEGIHGLNPALVPALPQDVVYRV